MNDLGLLIVWSAIQVSLVLSATVGLYVIASRRSPAAGAWVVSVGLLLSVVVGTLSLGFAGRPRRSPEIPVERQVSVTTVEQGVAVKGETHRAIAVAEAPSRSTLAGLRAAWERFDRTAAEPAARCRLWGTVLAVACLIGVGGGLLRLFAGLWGVHLIRRRGRLVDEPELERLVEELRVAMSCRRAVEIRETWELTAPATAGWRVPVILLPENWRSWNGEERRAVLAHELAHTWRNDYLMGIVARAAVALYFYHPLAHWLVSRLQLEQELAADALGARFGGGRTQYLRCLSRLALRQDGRLPCWPARAFVPAKGTLIRRIAMLREETKVLDRDWSRPRRTLAALLLVTVAVGALVLQGPIRADDAKRPAKSESSQDKSGAPGAAWESNKPFDLSYVIDDDSQGVMAFRPAATFHRAGMGIYRTALNVLIGQQWGKAANQFKFDATLPGQKPLRVEMFEQVAGNVRVFRTKGKKPNGRIALSMLSVRTTEPVDWVALGRLFGFKINEVQNEGRLYYRVAGGPTPRSASSSYLTTGALCLPESRSFRSMRKSGCSGTFGMRLRPLRPYSRRGRIGTACCVGCFSSRSTIEAGDWRPRSGEMIRWMSNLRLSRHCLNTRRCGLWELMMRMRFRFEALDLASTVARVKRRPARSRSFSASVSKRARPLWSDRSLGAVPKKREFRWRYGSSGTCGSSVRAIRFNCGGPGWVRWRTLGRWSRLG